MSQSGNPNQTNSVNKGNLYATQGGNMNFNTTNNNTTNNSTTHLYGPTAKGRWFLSRQNNIGELLKSMTSTIGNTIISSGMSGASGAQQIIPPANPPANSNTQFGDAGDFV